MSRLHSLLAGALVASVVAALRNSMTKDAPVPSRSLDSKYLRDHADTRGFMLGRPLKPKPTPDGTAVLFLRSPARTPKNDLFEFDVATGQTRALLIAEQVLGGAVEALSAEEKARRERQRVAVGGFTDFQISDDGKLVLVSLGGKLFVLERANGRVTELKTGTGAIVDPKFAPDSTMVAYVRDFDVYLVDLATNTERRVTSGGTERIAHGLAEFVAQEEMHRFSGYWWSPDSKFIAYEEADATGVETWHVADPSRPDQPATSFFYPRAGKANVKVRLGVVPVPTGDAAAPRETVWIKWDAEKFEYLASVRWEALRSDTRDGLLMVTVQNRDQSAVMLLQADATGGEVSPLIDEHDPEWVNLYPDVPRCWGLAHAGMVVWSTERFGALALTSLRQRQKLEVLVPEPVGFRGLVDFVIDARRGESQIVVLASDDPTQLHVVRCWGDRSGNANANDNEFTAKRLTNDAGIHDAVFAHSHALYALTSTRLDAMPATTVHRADGTLIGELSSVAEEPPFVPRAEIVKVGDEPGFHCAVVRPRDFDPKKKYPVIDHVYGGPTHNQVQASMPTMLLRQWLADQGFIVVAIDGRGTPGRGRNWQRAVAKKLGTVPLEDQVAGIKALGAKSPEMDLDRVGIVGWSFGGYMSALAVMREPDLFKAGVAGAPVCDWLDYDTHYTERYLGVPDLAADPTGGPAYREASLVTYAAKLRRPLLIVHGTADDNVYFRHSLKLTDALFRAGRDFELLPLAGATHMVRDPVGMEQMWTRIAAFFERHLASPRD